MSEAADDTEAPPPLTGWRILVPRAIHQAGALADPLRALGADPICLPVLRVVPPSDPGPLRAAVHALKEGIRRPDWLLFTSRNGVDAFFGALREQGGDARALAGVRLGAIGPATAEALARRELLVDLLPPRYVGEAVAETLLDAWRREGLAPETCSVWLPRAEVARDALPEALRSAGARVDVLPAYRTEGPDEAAARELRALFAHHPPHAVCFTSPSSVRFLRGALGPTADSSLERTVRAAIGPVTSEALRRVALPPHVEADPYTAPGLAEALSHYARRHPLFPRSSEEPS